MVKGVETKTIVGLEVGTSKVVAVVGEVFPDGVVNVLGVGSCPSKGLIVAASLILMPWWVRFNVLLKRQNLWLIVRL